MTTDDRPVPLPATMAYLESDAPVGLYAVLGDDGNHRRQESLTLLDINTGDLRTGPAVLLARVREPGELPAGVELVTIRPDGKHVIQQWCLL